MDLIKNQIRSFTSYCSNITKKLGKIDDLENILEEAKSELCKHDSKDNHDKYAKAKLNLELVWQNITNGAKIRSKER